MREGTETKVLFSNNLNHRKKNSVLNKKMSLNLARVHTGILSVKRSFKNILLKNSHYQQLKYD
jgi:hypothetical protein